MNKLFATLFLVASGAAMAQAPSVGVSAPAGTTSPQDIRTVLMECSNKTPGDNAKIEDCMKARGFKKQAEVKAQPVQPAGK